MKVDDQRPRVKDHHLGSSRSMLELAPDDGAQALCERPLEARMVPEALEAVPCPLFVEVTCH